MRRTSIFVLAAVFVVLALAACAAPAVTPTTPTTPPATTGGSTTPVAVTVSMKNIAFDPASVDIALGDSVTFVNNDTVQHVVAGDTWTSGAIDPGQTFTQKFTTAGANPVSCTIHPSMKMTVNVK
jgi:plastocyanin